MSFAQSAQLRCGTSQSSTSAIGLKSYDLLPILGSLSYPTERPDQFLRSMGIVTDESVESLIIPFDRLRYRS